MTDSFKVDMIVWSRNRACQLDLLLRSSKEHFKNIGIVYIVWKADDQKYLAGYEKLMSNDYGLNTKFVQERNFCNDIKNLLSSISTDCVLGNSDDNVFIRNVEFSDSKLDRNIVAFSLRLGKSINYCVPARLDLELPNFVSEDNDLLIWNWTKCDPRGGWGYPHPCDSHIYNRQYWLDLIKDGTFSNPRELEDYMNQHRDLSRPYLISFKKPRLVSISANEIGQGSGLINMGITLEELNKKFLSGSIISTSRIYDMTADSCHVLIDYEWVRS